MSIIAVLAGCTPTPAPTASEAPSPSPSASAPAYAGPFAFVGDELGSFLLTPEEITEIIPGAAEVGQPSDALTQISDGGGAPAIPAVCDVLYFEQSLGAIGARIVEWKIPSDTEYGFGRLEVLQFADEAHAQQRMDQLVAAAEQCAQFTKEAPVTFDSFIAPTTDDVRALAGTLTDVDSGYEWRAFNAFASTGNVVVSLFQPIGGDLDVDAEATAVLLQQRAEEARSALGEELTANPPVEDEDAVGEDGPGWSEWKIAFGGMGPIRVGDPIDQVLAAVGDAQVIEPTYAGGPWMIRDSADSASLLIEPASAGDAVLSITAGNDRSTDETSQAGTNLPSFAGLRLGDPVADAVTAHPEGTFVSVVAGTNYYYAISTRVGTVIRFITDRDAFEAGAVIVGITVENAAARDVWPTFE